MNVILPESKDEEFPTSFTTVGHIGTAFTSIY